MKVLSGWEIDKNHVFEIDKKEFLLLNNEDEVFRIEDYYIDSSCIFYAKGFRKEFKLVIDIGCHIIDENNLKLEYDINIWLYIDFKRKSKNIFQKVFITNSPHEAMDITFQWMKKFSYGKMKVEGYDLS